MENAVIQFHKLDEDKIVLLKKTICKDATDNELELFIHACNRTGLDPFMKQIYAIKRGGQMTIQTGIDGLRLIAERTGCYAPGRESTFTFENGQLISATSYVKKRISDGSWHEVAATAFFEEFNAGNNMWKKFPRVMTAKCAESMALRKAFPADMSGLYSEEEMEQADKPTATTPTIDVPAVEEKPKIAMINEFEAIRIEEALKNESGHIQNMLKFYKVNKITEIPENRLAIIWSTINEKVKKKDEEIPL